MHFECEDERKSQDKLQTMLMQTFVGETKSTMSIKVVLNKAYYSAHFDHHANLFVTAELHARASRARGRSPIAK